MPSRNRLRITLPTDRHPLLRATPGLITRVPSLSINRLVPYLKILPKENEARAKRALWVCWLDSLGLVRLSTGPYPPPSPFLMQQRAQCVSLPLAPCLSHVSPMSGVPLSNFHISPCGLSACYAARQFVDSDAQQLLRSLIHFACPALVGGLEEEPRCWAVPQLPGPAHPPRPQSQPERSWLFLYEPRVSLHW
jgi:hypothetical protein